MKELLIGFFQGVIEIIESKKDGREYKIVWHRYAWIFGIIIFYIIPFPLSFIFLAHLVNTDKTWSKKARTAWVIINIILTFLLTNFWLPILGYDPDIDIEFSIKQWFILNTAAFLGFLPSLVWGMTRSFFFVSTQYKADTAETYNEMNTILFIHGISMYLTEFQNETIKLEQLIEEWEKNKSDKEYASRKILVKIKKIKKICFQINKKSEKLSRDKIIEGKQHLLDEITDCIEKNKPWINKYEEKVLRQYPDKSKLNQFLEKLNEYNDYDYWDDCDEEEIVYFDEDWDEEDEYDDY